MCGGWVSCRWVWKWRKEATNEEMQAASWRWERPPPDSQQGHGNLSSTITENWLLSMIRDMGPFLKPPQRTRILPTFDFGLVRLSRKPAEPHHAWTFDLQKLQDSTCWCCFKLRSLYNFLWTVQLGWTALGKPRPTSNWQCPTSNIRRVSLSLCLPQDLLWYCGSLPGTKEARRVRKLTALRKTLNQWRMGASR